MGNGSMTVCEPLSAVADLDDEALDQLHHLDIEILGLTIRCSSFDVAGLHGSTVAVGLVDQRAQLERSVRDLEILEGPTDVGNSEAEDGASALVDSDHDAGEIDHPLGDWQNIDHQLAKTSLA